MKVIWSVLAVFLALGFLAPFVSSSGDAWQVTYHVEPVRTSIGFFGPTIVPGISGDYYLVGGHWNGWMLLIHLSPTGEVLWRKNITMIPEERIPLPPGMYQTLSDVAVGSDGIYIAGVTNVLFPDTPQEWPHIRSLFVIKLNFSGNSEWARLFIDLAGDAGEHPPLLQPTGDGVVVVTQLGEHLHHKDPNNVYDTDHIVTSNPDVAAMKFSSGGDFEWIHIYGREGCSQSPTAVGFDGKNVLITFYSDPTDFMDPGAFEKFGENAHPNLGLVEIDATTGGMKWFREYNQTILPAEIARVTGDAGALQITGPGLHLYKVPGGWLYNNGLDRFWDFSIPIVIKFDEEGKIEWSGFWNTTLYQKDAPASMVLDGNGNYVFMQPLVRMSPSGAIMDVYYTFAPDHPDDIFRSGDGYSTFLGAGGEAHLLKFKGDMNFSLCESNPGVDIRPLTGDDVHFVKLKMYEPTSPEWPGPFEFDDTLDNVWYKVSPANVTVHDHPEDFFYVDRVCGQSETLTQTESSTIQSSSTTQSQTVPTSTASHRETSTTSTQPSPSSQTTSSPSGGGFGSSSQAEKPSESHSEPPTGLTVCGPGFVVLLALTGLIMRRRR